MLLLLSEPTSCCRIFWFNSMGWIAIMSLTHASSAIRLLSSVRSSNVKKFSLSLKNRYLMVVTTGCMASVTECCWWNRFASIKKGSCYYSCFLRQFLAERAGSASTYRLLRSSFMHGDWCLTNCPFPVLGSFTQPEVWMLTTPVCSRVWESMSLRLPGGCAVECFGASQGWCAGPANPCRDHTCVHLRFSLDSRQALHVEAELQESPQRCPQWFPRWAGEQSSPCSSCRAPESLQSDIPGCLQ